MSEGDAADRPTRIAPPVEDVPAHTEGDCDRGPDGVLGQPSRGDEAEDAGSGSPPDDEINERVIPEYEAAIKRNAASFDQLALATLSRLPAIEPDEVERQVNAKYVEALLAGFEATEGRGTYFYCNDIVAAVALTVKDQGHRLKYFKRRERIVLHIVNNETDSRDLDLLKVLADIQRLAIAVSNQLKGDDLRVCMSQIYACATNVLDQIRSRVLARRSGTTLDDAEIVELAKSDADAQQQFYEASAQRDAQITYFGGMVLGAALLGFLAWILSLFNLPNLGRDFFTVVTLGGIGGIISVMSRMTSGKLVLRHRAGDHYIRFLGVFRPLTGATFAVVIYFAIVAGLIPLDVPQGGAAEMFFFAVTAFLAGFSERWAQDMLTVTKKNLAATGNQEDVGTGGD